ncbi:unnamed protein product [Linum tenue]|uniref:Uncharacterized protein n=1 Tax=Linum tenue TaxID=586396 RepID=A0AAV0PJN5_9ROSI|nr:unnamed protein product [Linum tenue]CAI0472113.1 unnamed protein product [Linum tenue]
MAWRSGTSSFSRSLMSAARAPSVRSSSAPLPRLRPSTASAPRVQSRRVSFSPSRNLGELGCVQSFLPLYSMVAKTHLASHLNANLRAFCELSHGRNGKDG